MIKRLKRYRGLSGEEVLTKQSKDLRDGTVQMVTFYLEKDTFEKMKENKYFQKEIKNFHKQQTNKHLISLNKLYLTKKFKRQGPITYLENKVYELFKNTKYIRIDNNIVYGAMPRDLIVAHHMYTKHKRAINELEAEKEYEKTKQCNV